MHDSYVGFDKEVPLQFDVIKDDTTREIADYNQAENDDEDEETSAGEDDD